MSLLSSKKQILTYQEEVILRLANDATALNAASYLSISTYDGGNQTVHPSILDLGNWNGHRYWMAITPYPNGNDSFENPCIYYSDDLVNWVVPSGLTNPIYPKPFQSHNSDPDLLFYNNTLYCYFNGVDLVDGQTQGHYVMWSTDGVNWSGPNVVVDADVPGGNLWAGFSPAVVYESTESMFYIYHIALGTGSQRVLRRFKSSTPTGVFTYDQDCIVNNLPSGLYNWHLDINITKGQYHGFFDLGASSGGDSTVLYFAVSNDKGLTWEVANSALINKSVSGWDNGKIYRASGIYTSLGTYELLYSAQSSTGVWQTGLTTVNFD